VLLIGVWAGNDVAGEMDGTKAGWKRLFKGYEGRIRMCCVRVG